MLPGHAEKSLTPSHWRKTEKGTNSGRQHPDIPSSPNASPTTVVEIETSKECEMLNASTQYDESKQPLSMSYNDERKEHKNVVASTPSQQKQPQLRPTQHAQSEFYISVPIFNETFNHSYRKKNQYVYVEKAEDDASLNQSLSRGPNPQNVHQDASSQIPPSGSKQNQQKQDQKFLQRNSGQRQRIHRGSGSKASSHTMSSLDTRYNYEHEIFQKAIMLMKSSQTSGLNIDSDDEDKR